MGGIPDELADRVKRWRNFKRDRPAKIEVPGPGQESVWDYPRPPIAEPTNRRVRAQFGGITLADSVRAYRVLETSSPPAYYIPHADIQTEYLEPSDHSSLCEWKGISQYWSIRVGEHFAENAAWSYPEPWPGYEAIQDYIAFYARSLKACFVDEQRVTPQPGEYYGGWITPDVVGPFKGGPGTERG